MITFTTLSYITTIAQLGSISEASEILYLSQPYLSKIIKGIEHDVGYSIFRRTNRGMILTEKGKLFIDAAQKINFYYNQIFSFNTVFEQKLQVALIRSLFFMPWFIEFKKNLNTQIQDKVLELNTISALSSVAKGETTVAFYAFIESSRAKHSNIIKSLSLNSVDLKTNLFLYVVISKHHKYAKMEYVTLDQLLSLNCVTFDVTEEKDFLNLLNIPYKNLLFVNDRGALLDSLKYGGYAFITCYFQSVSTQLDDLIAIPLLDCPITVNIAYATPKGYVLTDIEQSFIKFISNKLSN